jgi:hypothetical protein
MTSTDDLIHSLASAAGARRSASLRAAFAFAGAASLVCALLLVFSVIGIRHDFADLAVRLPFGFKLAYTGSLVFGTFVVALYAATPAASAGALYALSPTVILLALGIIFDPTAFPITGRTNTAVVFCVSSIVFLSLPAMVLMFGVMRKGAPTRPLFAGAVVLVHGGLRHHGVCWGRRRAPRPALVRSMGVACAASMAVYASLIRCAGFRVRATRTPE